MADQKTGADLGAIREPLTDDAGAKRSRWWWVLFLLLFLWVYGIRTGCSFLILSDAYAALLRPEAIDQLDILLLPQNIARLENAVMMVGIFLYPVQILGMALFPMLLAKLGLLGNQKAEGRITVGVLALSVVLLSVLLFTPNLMSHAALFYALLALLMLCPSVALGIVLRHGALRWREESVALWVGMAFALNHVCDELVYYSWIATNNALLHLGFGYAFFAGLPIAAAALRLRLRGEDAPALSPTPHAYPRHFPRNVGILIAAHALFSAAINTVIYFDNMDDFHTPAYELFFYVLALIVMLAATFLYHRRRWLAPALIGLLLICFGQGLSLFGIESRPLAVAYNLITMTGKVPPLMLAMIVPLYYAVGARRPELACLGFAIPAGADFLMMLTQLSEKGIGGVLPGHARQGTLLLIGLCLVGALFYLYTRFERARADALINGIREGRRERKSTNETVESLDLTAREKEVTTLLLAGDSQKMIAAKLNVSPSTVGFHIRNLYRKLNIQSKGELFALFLHDEQPAATWVAE